MPPNNSAPPCHESGTSSKKTLNLTFEIFRAQISPKSKMFCLKIQKKFLGKKTRLRNFFWPPNLKILSPSLVLGATTVYVCSTYYISYQKKWMLRSCCWVSKCSILGPWLQAILQRRRIFPLRRIRATILGPFSFSKQRTLKSKRKHK